MESLEASARSLDISTSTPTQAAVLTDLSRAFIAL
jgi:hypothetical protein